MGAKTISSEDYEKKYVGKTIGNMLVIGYGYFKNKRHFVKTKCLICGEESIRRIDRKNNKYCKKCQSRSFKSYDHEKTAFNKQFNVLRNSAKIRNIVFDITKEDVLQLINKPCYYCGEEPTTSSFSSYGRNHSKISSYISNGVDRIDSNIGYILSNLVPCCSTCNMMKNKFSKELFFEKVKLIYHKHIS